MREVIYKFNSSGRYVTEGDTYFYDDSRIKIIIEPHDFSITISSEILRKSSCKGYVIELSNKGEVVFYDDKNNLIKSFCEQNQEFKQFDIDWGQDSITINFGETITVDYYPNCDGEYDRWGSEWNTQYSVTLDLNFN